MNGSCISGTVSELHTSIKKKRYHQSVNLKHVSYDHLQHHDCLSSDGKMMLQDLCIQTNNPELAPSPKKTQINVTGTGPQHPNQNPHYWCK
jgi:hypothetical protein